MVSDEHLFMCLWAIYMSSLENVCSDPLPIFLIGFFFFFLMLSCMSSLCIRDINPLLDISFTNILFHSVDYLFVLLIVSFIVQKLFSLV